MYLIRVISSDITRPCVGKSRPVVAAAGSGHLQVPPSFSIERVFSGGWTSVAAFGFPFISQENPGDQGFRKAGEKAPKRQQRESFRESRRP